MNKKEKIYEVTSYDDCEYFYYICPICNYRGDTRELHKNKNVCKCGRFLKLK
jgi:hypothetical protein